MEGNREPDPSADDEALAERGSPVFFESDALVVLPERRGSRIPYGEIVHVSSSQTALAIGTTVNVLMTLTGSVEPATGADFQLSRSVRFSFPLVGR